MKKIALITLFTCARIYVWAQVNIITTIAGNDSAAYCCDGGFAIAAELNSPDQLCLDHFGNLYIADPGNNRIRKIILSTGIITTIAGTGNGAYSGDSGQATNAELWAPDGVCTDAFGNVYISDAANSRIRKITAATGIITTFVGNGVHGNSGDGQQATNAEIDGPQGITIDRQGNFYLTDIFNNNLRKVDVYGIITTVAGNGSYGYSGDGGYATNAQLKAPGDVGVDTAGNIIFSDDENHRVRKVNAVTGIITTIAGTGTAVYSGDGGFAVDASLYYPYGIYIDKKNNIYIVGGNIRKIDGLTGTISAIVGTNIEGFSGDGGPANAAELRADDMFMDSLGVMYIADYGNNRIRVVYDNKLATPNLQAGNKNYKIYPSPNDGNFIIQEIEPHVNPVTAIVLDAIGRVIYKEDLIFSSSKSEIKLSNCVPGMYMLEITSSENVAFRSKFVIAK